MCVCACTRLHIFICLQTKCNLEILCVTNNSKNGRRGPVWSHVPPVLTIYPNSHFAFDHYICILLMSTHFLMVWMRCIDDDTPGKLGYMGRLYDKPLQRRHNERVGVNSIQFNSKYPLLLPVYINTGQQYTLDNNKCNFWNSTQCCNTPFYFFTGSVI